MAELSHPLPTVTIVLVTWNGWSLLERCLRSLMETGQAGPEVEVLVVDNGSTDGTAEGLARDFSSVRYLPQTTNLGFARANNIGVAAASAELVLLLNNDTVVEPRAITALVAAARAHPEFDIFVPEMRCLAAPEVVDNRGIYLDATGHFRQIDSGEPVARQRPPSEVFGASGGTCLLRRDIVRRIGLFDEALESYLEDCDFAARARASGFRALFVPESRVLHVGSATGARIADRKFFLIQRNMHALWRRWFAPAPWRLTWWLGLAYEAFQGVKAVRAGRARLFVRAKRAASAITGPARDRKALLEWVGVSGRAIVLRLVHVFTAPESFHLMQGQAAFMQARGIDCIGISSPGDYLSTYRAREGVEVLPVNMPRRITPGRDLIAVLRLTRLLRRLRPDIVHAHTPKGGLLGMIAAWLARVPVRIYHMRGLPFMTASGYRRRLLLAAERLSCALAHRVICVSHSLRGVALEHHLAAPEKIVTLLAGSGNGVDARERFSPEAPPGEAARRQALRGRLAIPQDATVLAFVGRLVRDKGVVELAAAWAVLRDRWPDVHLVMAGLAERQDPVPRVTQEQLRSDPRVHLLGSVDDPRDVYAAADTVVLPTYREGFPNVLLEAAAMRRPVVATCIPGCVDAVADGETGLLVPVADAGALATALERYVRDPALRARHGTQARERVLREFQREAIWEALYDEYAALLRTNGRRVPAAGR